MHVQLHYGVWLAGRLCQLEKSKHTSHVMPSELHYLIQCSDTDTVSAVSLGE